MSIDGEERATVSVESMAAGQGCFQRQQPLVSQDRLFHNQGQNATKRNEPYSAKRQRRHRHPGNQPARVQPHRHYPPQAKRQAVRRFDAYLPPDWTDSGIGGCAGRPSDRPESIDLTEDAAARHQRDTYLTEMLNPPPPPRMYREPVSAFAPRSMEHVRNSFFPSGDEARDQRIHLPFAAPTPPLPPPGEDWRRARSPYDAGDYAARSPDELNPIFRDDPLQNIRRQDPLLRDHGLSGAWTQEAEFQRPSLSGSSAVQPQLRQDDRLPSWPTDQRVVAAPALYPDQMSNDRRLAAAVAAPPPQGPVHVHFAPVQHHINVHVHPATSETQKRRRRTVSHLLKNIDDLIRGDASP